MFRKVSCEALLFCVSYTIKRALSRGAAGVLATRSGGKSYQYSRDLDIELIVGFDHSSMLKRRTTTRFAATSHKILLRLFICALVVPMAGPIACLRASRRILRGSPGRKNPL